MEKTTKLTYKEVVGKVLEMEEVKANAEYVEVLEKLLASLNKKSTSRSKKENEEHTKIKNEILRVLGTMQRATITQLCKESELLGSYSPNKVSAMVTQLKKATPAQVIRTEEKKIAYFSLPTTTQEEEIDNEEIED